MEQTTMEIEQQLLKLLRRGNAIHVRTSAGEIELERSSYGILCLIADEGPQRLGAIAHAFSLDPSTITRQVQTVVRLKLAEKSIDSHDRRASILSLTPEGATAIEQARSHRREMLDLVMREWTPEERAEFCRALRRFNTTIDDWVAHGLPHQVRQRS